MTTTQKASSALTINYDRAVFGGSIHGEQLAALADGTYVTTALINHLTAVISQNLKVAGVHIDDTTYQGCLAFWWEG